jgi:hypothetical protein
MLNEGKSLSQWEMGNAFKRMLTGKFTVDMIVERTGHKKNFIEDAIAMADAPEEIKEMLSAKAVTPWAVLSALKVMHPDRAVETLKTQVQEKQSKGEKGPVKRAKKPIMASKVAPPARPVDLSKKSLAEVCPKIVKALTAVMEDVALADLNDESVTRVSVDKGLLLQLAAFMVTESDAAAVSNVK